MRRHERGEASVVPVMLRAVNIVDASLAALARIASDQEPFDLVLSVWQRPEPIAGAPSAGIRLLRELRARHLTIPVVFYHGSSDERERSARRELALSEGASGEAVMPDELLALVISAVRVH